MVLFFEIIIVAFMFLLIGLAIHKTDSIIDALPEQFHKINDNLKFILLMCYDVVLSFLSYGMLTLLSLSFELHSISIIIAMFFSIISFVSFLMFAILTLIGILVTAEMYSVIILSWFKKDNKNDSSGDEDPS